MGFAPLLGVPFLGTALGVAALGSILYVGYRSFEDEFKDVDWKKVGTVSLLGGAGLGSLFLAFFLPKQSAVPAFIVGTLGLGSAFYYLRKADPPLPSEGVTGRPESESDYRDIRARIEKPGTADVVGLERGWELSSTDYDVRIQWANIGNATVPFKYRFRVTEVPILTEAGREMRDSIPDSTTETDIKPLPDSKLTLGPGGGITIDYEVDRLIPNWDAREVQFHVDVYNAFTNEWFEVAKTVFTLRLRAVVNG